ncbi:MAG: hypothetical protein KAX38_09095 [Candidatus Krumholzibacteria bacterium]|nr:hypothetical protein [Candidatus Krumholzibacteria bacterium]
MPGKMYPVMMVGVIFIGMLLSSCGSDNSTDPGRGGGGGDNAIIIDHNCTGLWEVPESAIENAKAGLHIAYGHTSHGSQLTTGMTGLIAFAGSLYSYNNGGTGGSLDLRDRPFSGANDLGNPDRTSWATATRDYLDANPDINVVIWSWCGQVSTAGSEDIDTYLDLMNALEVDYPDVKIPNDNCGYDSDGNMVRDSNRARLGGWNGS